MKMSKNLTIGTVSTTHCEVFGVSDPGNFGP